MPPHTSLQVFVEFDWSYAVLITLIKRVPLTAAVVMRSSALFRKLLSSLLKLALQVVVRPSNTTQPGSNRSPSVFDGCFSHVFFNLFHLLIHAEIVIEVRNDFVASVFFPRFLDFKIFLLCFLQILRSFHFIRVEEPQGSVRTCLQVYHNVIPVQQVLVVVLRF